MIEGMKRIGNIMSEVVEYSNMYESYKQVLRGTKRKQSQSGQRIIQDTERILTGLSESLADGSFEISGYKDIDVVEGGKLRHIQVLSLRERIAINAVMRVVDKHLLPRYIRTTSASIVGRGMHDLMKYIRDDIRNDVDGTRYCLKMDIHKFYESIDQDAMMDCVKRVFKDKILICLLDKFVRMMPSGISIGLRSSQCLGNLLLSVVVDHYLKDELGVKYYYRYCDDMVVLSSNKEYLWSIYNVIKERLDGINLEIKDNVRVFPTEQGIDFIGYVIFPDHVLLRKRIKKKFARKMHEVKSSKRRDVLIASFYGMTKHADCCRLFKKLTNKDMKKFSEMGVVYTPADGKKRFPGQTVSLKTLINLEIEVHDYETDIKTSEGEGRYLVSIRIKKTGEWKKFFTASEEMKAILDQISDMEDGFPFETVLEPETFDGNKVKYKFT